MSARERVPFRVRPMLATLVPEPFHKPGWVYEEKYDGYRLLAYKEGDRVTLLSRNDKDRTATYAEIAAAVRDLAPRTLALDGEAVAFDENRVSRFQLLQQGQTPAVYAVFDCLYVQGRDLRRQPLRARRQALLGVLGRSRRRLFPSQRLARSGLEAYEKAKKRGFEGVVAKDLASPYVEGRSKYWLKFKVRNEEEFVIGGYTPPRGSRQHFGALLLGAYDGDGKLQYVGKVGTGFDTDTLASLHARFQPLVRSRPPFVDPPRAAGVRWLAPKLVAQISFLEWTQDMRLRHPVFLGLRDDKSPSEVRLPRRKR